jgi:hypothetical protein
MQACHPNIWTFLGILKREQALYDVQINHMLVGQPPPPKRRKYKDSDQRINTIVATFHERDILDYLRGIAYNFSF